jgi:hypothetical protein
MQNAVVRALVAFAVLAAGAAAFAKPTPPVEIAIQVPRVVESASAMSTISVHFLTSVAAARVRVHGTGSMELAERIEEPTGPFAAGQGFSFQLLIKPAGPGQGSLVVTVEALDAEHSILFTRTQEVFAEAGEGVLWISTSSPTDLRFTRIDMMAARLGLPYDTYRTLEEDILTTRVPGDWTARPLLPFTAMEQNVERAFPTAAPPGDSKEHQKVTAAAKITVKGRVEWTDRTGRRHGLPKAAIEIREADGANSTLLATVETDAGGNYTAAVAHDDGTGEGNPDIFVRALARSPVAELKPDKAGAATYQLQSPTSNDVADGTTLTVNLTAGNTDDSETVFSLHHALVVIGAYTATLAGTAPPRITVRFPTTQGGTFYSGTEIHVLRLDRWDWDVVHHEYGHYVMDTHNFQKNPGGPHSSSENLAEKRGKDVGIRLAWGEGWPTFFGIAGQQVLGTSSLNVPNVGDIGYQDTEDLSTNINLETSTGRGEDNELSVMTLLWDLFDAQADGDDTLTISDKDLFTTFKSAGVTTIGGAWEALVAAANTGRRVALGAAFGQALITSRLTAPADQTAVSTTAPTFRWAKNGAGTANPLNDFSIVFYNDSFATIIFQKNVGNTDQFTPTAADLQTILGSGTPVRWIVQGKNTTVPATPGGTVGRYWSGSRRIIAGGTPLAATVTSTGTLSTVTSETPTTTPTQFAAEIAITPGKPDAPTEVIELRRTSAGCSLRTVRKKDTSILAEAHASLTASDCAGVWQIAQQLRQNSPKPSGAPVPDFGSRTLRIQWTPPGTAVPQQQMFEWDRELQNDETVKPLIERLIELARKKLPNVTLNYF